MTKTKRRSRQQRLRKRSKLGIERWPELDRDFRRICLPFYRRGGKTVWLPFDQWMKANAEWNAAHPPQ